MLIDNYIVPQIQLIISSRLKHKIDKYVRYVNIVNVVLFANTSIGRPPVLWIQLLNIPEMLHYLYMYLLPLVDPTLCKECQNNPPNFNTSMSADTGST